jgi:hypothetical protein
MYLTKGGTPAFSLGEAIEIPRSKIINISLDTGQPNTSVDFLDLNKQWEMDMNFGTWNVKSLYWSGTLKTLDREFATYRSDLLGV